jgi:hypothetical protein
MKQLKIAAVALAKSKIGLTYGIFRLISLIFFYFLDMLLCCGELKIVAVLGPAQLDFTVRGTMSDTRRSG